MNDLFQIVNDLEAKLSKILGRQAMLQEENIRLLQENNQLQQEVEKRDRELKNLENRYESLRVAKTMVGSKEDKHVTKLKINTLIREIDKCIVQLSD